MSKVAQRLSERYWRLGSEGEKDHRGGGEGGGAGDGVPVGAQLYHLGGFHRDGFWCGFVGYNFKVMD